MSLSPVVKIAAIGGVLAYFFRDQIAAAISSTPATTAQTGSIAQAAAAGTVYPAIAQPVGLPPVVTQYYPAPSTATTQYIAPLPIAYIPPPPTVTQGPGGGGSFANLTYTPTSSSVTSLVPITDNTLIQASFDPNTAAILGSDPRGLLNWDQWAYYRAKGGKPQITADGFDPGNRQATMTAQEFQRRVAAMGLA